MYGRILKPISSQHNAAISSVHMDRDTEKMLSLSKNVGPKSADIDAAIISLISPEWPDDEALARVYLVGNKLIPYLIKYVFSPRSSCVALSNAKLSVQRLLSLPIVIEKLNGYETLIRFFICQAYDTKNINARIFTIDLLDAICKREDNKVILGRYPGLINMLVETISKTDDDKLKERGVSIICSLASNNLNKSSLSEPKIIDLVIGLCHDKKYNIQLLAVDTLRHLSTSGRHESALVSYRGGLLLEILQKLTKDILKRRVVVSSLKTLTNLITCMTASQIVVSHPSLLCALAIQAADCCLDDIALAAAEALNKFTLHIDATHVEHSNLLRALSIMLVSPTKSVVSLALRSLLTHAERKVNCPAIALSQCLMSEMTALLTLANNNRLVLIGVFEVLKKISRYPTSALIMIDNRKLVTKILDLSKMIECNNQEIHEHAVKITLALVSNKKAAVKLADMYGFRVGFMV